ncbi:DNA cytosine methyltransferase [Anaerostipes sp.]|uniref:DNA cytosine methyltransferase n=1 Tax=Anaerostipes sp. TaxID=1872530 RepID=UPI0039671E0F
MPYNYIDLFSGAGGLSLGFDKAGFKNIFAVEFNADFAKTYKKNFPKHKLIVDDIRNISNSMIKEITNNQEIDVIIGGPPCQGFSIAGNIGRSFIEDERNELFKEFVRFVEGIQPKVFLMENVAAMATHLKGKTIKIIIDAFKNVGYKVKYKVLNSVDYEVAQERRRIVIVGVRNDINSDFFYPEKAEKKLTIKDVIDDLPKLKSGEKSNIPNHNAMKHTEQMLKKMSYIKDGGNRNDIPEEIRPKSGDIRKYIRYDSSKPSICITGDMRKVFHYEQNRALTARELARIQSFPDDFIFEGSSIKIQQQIGNAVPPKLAYQLALQIKETLNDNGLS